MKKLSVPHIFFITQIVSVLSISGSSLALQIVHTINDINVHILQGDITQLSVDAIVNAANKELQGGSGVCGAIFSAAGAWQLQNACNQFRSGCPVGEAVVTSSFKLVKFGIKYIIHAVGPKIHQGKQPTKKDANALYSTYYQSLLQANKLNISSIAFPFISSGIYGYPKKDAAQIALEVFNAYSCRTKGTIKDIYFVLFSHHDFALVKSLFIKMIN